MHLLNNQLYSIKQYKFENNIIDATIQINKVHPIFKGHFPGQPVLPGVCMLQISQEMIEKAIDTKLLMTQTGQVKFLKIIDPVVDDAIRINITLNENLTMLPITWQNNENTSTLKYNASFTKMK